MPIGIFMGMVLYAYGYWRLPTYVAPTQAPTRAESASAPSASSGRAGSPDEPSSAEQSSSDDLWFERREAPTGVARRTEEAAARGEGATSQSSGLAGVLPAPSAPPADARPRASSVPAGPASAASSWLGDFDRQQQEEFVRDVEFDAQHPPDRPGQAFSVGTFCDTLDYAALRVPGLTAENARRRGPHQDCRNPLLMQIERNVASREAEAHQLGQGSDVAHAEMPRPLRRGRSVGCAADLRDFPEMRVEALKEECRIRGLSVRGLRHEMLRRVLYDVEQQEVHAADRER